MHQDRRLSSSCYMLSHELSRIFNDPERRILMTIETKHRNGNGQTCCKGCLEKYNGNTIAARNWDCMLMDVFKDGENIGIYCSTCLHELMANEFLNEG